MPLFDISTLNLPQLAPEKNPSQFPDYNVAAPRTGEPDDRAQLEAIYGAGSPGTTEDMLKERKDAMAPNTRGKIIGTLIASLAPILFGGKAGRANAGESLNKFTAGWDQGEQARQKNALDDWQAKWGPSLDARKNVIGGLGQSWLEKQKAKHGISLEQAKTAGQIEQDKRKAQNEALYPKAPTRSYSESVTTSYQPDKDGAAKIEAEAVDVLRKVRAGEKITEGENYVLDYYFKKGGSMVDLMAALTAGQGQAPVKTMPQVPAAQRPAMRPPAGGLQAP